MMIDARQPRRVMMGALLFFVVWTLATWVFEGRIQTLLRPDAVGDRIIYALGVNLLFGIGGAIAFLRYWVQRDALDVQASGFRPSTRTLISIIVGFVLGLAAYVLQGAPSMHPVVILNAFAQVFVVSAAEVVVCWAVVGSATEAAIRSRGLSSRGTIVISAVVASVLFGVYHYAHSAPFNTFAMVALLSVVGLFTSAFFFISRDVAGTIVFHNFLGTFGVVQALKNANALPALEAVQPPLLITALLTAALVWTGYLALSRGRKPIHAHA